MAKKKLYAVRKGRITGVFDTWEACREAVDGYPGAQYKSFSTKKEAEGYVAGTEDIRPEPGQIVAYVDGSFDAKKSVYAFGCVLLTSEGEIIRESGNGNNPESAALRNVTGEMLGSMYAVKWCEVNGYGAVEICYDYTGIEMWATGAWKAKNDLTQKYAAFMKEHRKKMQITFRKIAAHTGNQYNEEADKLAKKALTEGDGIPKMKRESEA